MEHYVVFEAPQDGHSVVTMLQAASRYEALKRYFETEYLPAEARLNEDGTVTDLRVRRPVAYPHLLAFIEAERKAWGEWQVRRLPAGTWDAPYREVFCGERRPDVENYFDLCRPLFRRQFPRSRARAFYWYLTDGYLVTFYRRPRRSRQPLEILRRYIIRHDTYPDVRPWEGSYDEIWEHLLL